MEQLALKDTLWSSGTLPSKIPPIPDYEAMGLDSRHHPRIWDAVNKGWQPGNEGKALLYDGNLYTWNTQKGNPNHGAILQLITASRGEEFYDPSKAQDYFYISPDGGLSSSYGMEDIAKQQDPRLHRVDRSEGMDWNFVASESDFWEQQRKQDFPEDFEPDVLEAGETPIQYTKGDILQIIKQPIETGHIGKGLMDESTNDIIAEWPVDKFGGPHHDEVCEALRIYDPVGIKFMLIGNDGRWYDPYEMPDADWNFVASTEDSHVLNWDEGNEGKGLIFDDGRVHTWNEDDYPVHDEYLDDHPELPTPTHYLYISPGGKCNTAWGSLGPVETELLSEAHPTLHADVEHGHATWEFGA